MKKGCGDIHEIMEYHFNLLVIKDIFKIVNIILIVNGTFNTNDIHI